MHQVRGAVLSGFLVAALAMAWAAPTGATTMIRLSTEELTVMSELVIEGTVTDIESRFHTEHQYVYTYVTLDVDRVLKGTAPSGQIVLEELGGDVDGMHVTVPGAPAYAVGERVIVFTEWKANTGHHRTVALAQGKFRVVEDAAAGATYLVRPQAIEDSFNTAADGRLDSTIDPDTGRRGYDGFVATVEEWADRLAAPGGGR